MQLGHSVALVSGRQKVLINNKIKRGWGHGSVVEYPWLQSPVPPQKKSLGRLL